FPGGVVRSTDGSVIEAALREAREEIGVEAAAGGGLGVFDDVPPTGANFVISPGLGLALGAPRFPPRRPASGRVIEMPVAHLLQPGAFRLEEWEREGVRRPVVFVSYGEDVVWGTTGRILRELLDALFPEVRLVREVG